MNMPSTNFRNTLTAREAYKAMKTARYAVMSVVKEYVDMMDASYALGLKAYSNDDIEGVRTTVDGDSKIRTFLDEMEGGARWWQ